MCLVWNLCQNSEVLPEGEFLNFRIQVAECRRIMVIHPAGADGIDEIRNGDRFTVYLQIVHPAAGTCITGLVLHDIPGEGKDIFKPVIKGR